MSFRGFFIGMSSFIWGEVDWGALFFQHEEIKRCKDTKGFGEGYFGLMDNIWAGVEFEKAHS